LPEKFGASLNFWFALYQVGKFQNLKYSLMSSDKLVVSYFSTRLLSSCTDGYVHTYDIYTYWSCESGL